MRFADIASSPATPCSHPKPGNPTVEMFHLGLSRLETYALAILSSQVSGRPGALVTDTTCDEVIEKALRLMRAVQRRCPACLNIRREFWLGVEAYYICVSKPCPRYLKSDLEQEDAEAFKAALTEIEASDADPAYARK
jgi:hypothetical protein